MKQRVIPQLLIASSYAKIFRGCTLPFLGRRIPKWGLGGYGLGNKQSNYCGDPQQFRPTRHKNPTQPQISTSSPPPGTATPLNCPTQLFSPLTLHRPPPDLIRQQNVVVLFSSACDSHCRSCSNHVVYGGPYRFTDRFLCSVNVTLLNG